MPLGYHLKKGSIADGNFADGIIRTYGEISDYGMKPCIQIFVMGPSNSKIILSEEDKKTLAAWPHRSDVVIHGSYISIPWGLKPGGTEVLKTELTICSDIGANGVIVHLHPNAHNIDVMTKVLTKVAQLPASVLGGPRIWLENKPVRGGVRHCTPGEVKELFEMIQTVLSRLNPKPKIGFCIDTQHAFASGVELGGYDETREWLNSLRKALPEEFPMMIHLNDSKAAKGSGLDRHEDLCKGLIWGEYGLEPGKEDPSYSGITACVLWAEEHNVCLILETPNSDKDIKFLQYIGFK